MLPRNSLSCAISAAQFQLSSIVDSDDDRCAVRGLSGKVFGETAAQTTAAMEAMTSSSPPADVTSPDATQPRVTVRPKPPVLLGATSTMPAGIAPGSCRTTPARGRPRRLQGSRRDAPRNIAERILVPAPVALPLRGSLPALDPALQRSLGFPPVRLAAPLRASLACTFRCSLEVRRALVSELKTGCTSCHARSMGIREIQTFSPPFFRSSPSTAAAIPSSSPW